jgi:hypothetical protein
VKKKQAAQEREEFARDLELAEDVYRIQLLRVMHLEREAELLRLHHHRRFTGGPPWPPQH